MQPDQNTALVSALRQAADVLVARRSLRDLELTLGEIVVSAVDTVPGADDGGISMTENSHIASRVPTTGAIRDLDDLQAKLAEGPCISAILEPTEDGIIHAEDLAAEPDASRWPEFAPQAVAVGYRSMLSTRLSTRPSDGGGGLRAALNLYSHQPRAFDLAGRTLAGLFGVQAALLLYGAEQASHLEQALITRDVIGQAKGILMERFDVDEDRAFQMLVSSSQQTNLKLVDVARWLTSGDGRAIDTT